MNALTHLAYRDMLFVCFLFVCHAFAIVDFGNIVGLAQQEIGPVGICRPI